MSFGTPETWAKDKIWKDWHIVEVRRDFLPAMATASLMTSNINVYYSDWPMKFKPQLELALSTEVITGWRAWKIVDFERRGGLSEKRLQALGTPPVWEPYKENVAICMTDGKHEAPWPTCHCGFWAFKSREHVEESLFHTYGGESGKAIGQIALWGRVLECVNGFRGEYSYPQTLQFVNVEKNIAKEVAECYGVPYSIVKPTSRLKCVGALEQWSYDMDCTYALVRYDCGLSVRAEISNCWEGKLNFDPSKIPPCPHHH